MTREEQLIKQAEIYTNEASNYAEWSDDEGLSVTNVKNLLKKHLSTVLNGLTTTSVYLRYGMI